MDSTETYIKKPYKFVYSCMSHHHVQPPLVGTQFHVQTPLSHKEKGLVTIEQFLGGAESIVLIWTSQLNCAT